MKNSDFLGEGNSKKEPLINKVLKWMRLMKKQSHVYSPSFSF